MSVQDRTAALVGIAGCVLFWIALFVFGEMHPGRWKTGPAARTESLSVKPAAMDTLETTRRAAVAAVLGSDRVSNKAVEGIGSGSLACWSPSTKPFMAGRPMLACAP